jgi:hypothetical protein
MLYLPKVVLMLMDHPELARLMRNVEVKLMLQPSVPREKVMPLESAFLDGGVSAMLGTPPIFVNPRAPAAIMEKEPKCEVKENGVKFGVNDIKALMTQMYDAGESNTIFAGSRCQQFEPALDAYSRFGDYNCRDISPDLFHLVLTNMIGRLKHSFVADVDAKAAVWNQPVRQYKVVRNDPISAAEANNLVGFGGSSEWSFNGRAASLRYIQVHFSYIGEAFDVDEALTYSSAVDKYTATKQYGYILELDASGAIIGGEWVGNTKYDHVDFIWYFQNINTH